MIDLASLTLQCGPEISSEFLQRIISVESSFNPYAIGVVGGRLARQPANKDEAATTARYLANAGWNFSMGLGQINRYNLEKYGLNYDSVFEPCANLRAAAGIYGECFNRAVKVFDTDSARLKAFSCYYSGNFSRGFANDAGLNTSYVERIMNVSVPNAPVTVMPIPVIPTGGSRDKDRAATKTGGITKKQGSDDRQLRHLRQQPLSAGIKQLRGG
nr:lytic transglycosylase domain-containing protein [uncultured Enterobacter sp.]